TPATREVALDTLGRMLRRVHDLPLAPDPDARPPRELVAGVWAELAELPVPGFVGDAARRMIAEDPPARDRAPVLSHNDVNPTNLVYDGDRVMLLDWDVAGENDPYYDLAAIAVFLRMDDATCRALVAAHDAAPISADLPARFTYMRRVVATLCGLMFIR